MATNRRGFLKLAGTGAIAAGMTGSATAAAASPKSLERLFASNSSADGGTPGSVDPGIYDQDGMGHHNSRWAIIAKPDTYGSSGKRHYIINEENTIWYKDDPNVVGLGPAGFAFPLNPAQQGYKPLDK